MPAPHSQSPQKASKPKLIKMNGGNRLLKDEEEDLETLMNNLQLDEDRIKRTKKTTKSPLGRKM